MIEQAPASQTFFATPADPDIAQLALLRLLNERPELSQRELSAALGLSLGKTHYVLHALLDRGLVKVRNFKRNDNKLAYAYLLTPAGLGEKMSLTRRFLARKEAEFEQLQSAIATLRAEVEGESQGTETHP
jgi:EPS-associated MarR family transcriptional regulator